MYCLDLDNTISALLQVESVDESDPFAALPQNIDRERFILFYRIMTAHTTGEIADIPTEVIISMWENASEYGAFFEHRTHPVMCAANTLRQVKSITRRRIL